MRTIGFAGTAKNTGKTTAALHVIDLARMAGLTVGLTSIGFDGENRDQVTGLPKPRYALEPGLWVATAENCIPAGTAELVVHAVTDAETILGRVVIAQVRRPGLVLLAGPNRSCDLRQVLARFAELRVDLAVVDGALNRIVPMAETDGLVISTGAALNADIPTIAQHARQLAALFDLPLEDGRPAPGIAVQFRQDPPVTFAESSILSEATFQRIIAAASASVEALVIPGVCDPRVFTRFLNGSGSAFRDTRFVFGSPLKLIASAGPDAWERVIQQARQAGHAVSCMEKVPLRMVTVNPFYPRYTGRSGFYEAAWVDPDALIRAVQQAIPEMPVVDVMRSERVAVLGLIDNA